MGETFSQKKIEITIHLATDTKTNQPNTFADPGSGGGGDTVAITDKRTSVRIQNSGRPSSSTAQVMIYGLSGSLMNQLTTLGMKINVIPKNEITVKAGDESVGMTTVFFGTIAEAYGDYSSAPDVPFVMNCRAALAAATSNAPATSYRGTTDVATIMAGFARQMNVGFENNGITTQVHNPYYRGSVEQQFRRAREDAGINAEILGNILAIWPLFGSRNLTRTPVIAAPPDGSMIGSPSFTQQGILVRNLFLPDIAFGGKVQVRTAVEELQKANGIWTIHKLDLALDSQIPKGNWSSTFYCYDSSPSNPIIPPK